MDSSPVDRDDDLPGIERLGLDLAEPGAVERVGVLGAEIGEVEMVGAAADLLVDGEADAKRRVLGPRVTLEAGDRRHDLGHPGLVVGAEQRCAVRRDEVVPDLLGERRLLVWIEYLRLVAGEDDSRAVVGAMKLRRDPCPGHVRRGVDMGDQPDHRRPFAPGSDA